MWRGVNMTKEEMDETMREPTEDTWITKEGEAILVKDMTDSHLVNTVKMLLKQAPGLRAQFIDQAEITLSHMQGEMSQLSIEQDINYLNRMDDEEFLEYYHPTGEALMQEVYKRGLLDEIYYIGG